MTIRSGAAARVDERQRQQAVKRTGGLAWDAVIPLARDAER